jgi:hypothetical protein
MTYLLWFLKPEGRLINGSNAEKILISLFWPWLFWVCWSSHELTSYLIFLNNRHKKSLNSSIGRAWDFQPRGQAIEASNVRNLFFVGAEWKTALSSLTPQNFTFEILLITFGSFDRFDLHKFYIFVFLFAHFVISFGWWKFAHFFWQKW